MDPIEIIVITLLSVVVIGTGINILISRSVRASARAKFLALNSYFEQLNTVRTFPEVTPDNVILRGGEFCVLFCSGRLFQTRSHRSSAGYSVRVAKGLSVGQRQYYTKESLDPVANGSICITNKRVIFTSTTNTVAIDMPDIVSIDFGGVSSVTIQVKKRQRPVVLDFNGDAALAFMLVRLFIDYKVSENRLPEGMTVKMDSTGERSLSLCVHQP